tara:strand:- start:859 stop:1407 length:549 start_codon:yes stop_codon:yes gene_type:complete
MCGLVELQIASALFKLDAEKKGADAQSAANAAATSAAQGKTRNDIALSNIQRKESYVDASDAANSANAAANKAISTGVVAAGESGVAMGGSALAQLRELGAQGSSDIVTSMTNFVRESGSIDAQYQNIFITEANTIARLPPVKAPDYFSAALSIAAADAGLQKDTGQGIFGHTKDFFGPGVI